MKVVRLRFWRKTLNLHKRKWVQIWKSTQNLKIGEIVRIVGFGSAIQDFSIFWHGKHVLECDFGLGMNRNRSQNATLDCLLVGNDSKSSSECDFAVRFWIANESQWHSEGDFRFKMVCEWVSFVMRVRFWIVHESQSTSSTFRPTHFQKVLVTNWLLALLSKMWW